MLTCCYYTCFCRWWPRMRGTKATKKIRLHKSVTCVPTFPTVPVRERSEEITVYFRPRAFLLHWGLSPCRPPRPWRPHDRRTCQDLQPSVLNIKFLRDTVLSLVWWYCYSLNRVTWFIIRYFHCACVVWKYPQIVFQNLIRIHAF